MESIHPIEYLIHGVGGGPDLEVDGQTPLAEEEGEARVSPQSPHTGLGRTETLIRTHKLHRGRVVLPIEA